MFFQRILKIILLFKLYFSFINSMSSNSTICKLILSTNLNILNNYGWSCDDTDCNNDNFLLFPQDAGVCHSNEIIELSLDNINNIAALTGTIPQYFGEITAPLSKLILAQNKLTGSIPFNLPLIHTSLTYIDIRDNKFTGTIPSSFCDINIINTMKFAGNNNIFCYAHCLSSIPNQDYGSVPRCGK